MNQNMIFKLIVIFSIVFSASTFVILEAGNDSKEQPIPFLLWVASDPAEDDTVSKVNVSKFLTFMESHQTELVNLYNGGAVLEAVGFFRSYYNESGTKGVNWATVFAKFALKKILGITEDKEHGLPSLAAWAVRNTGPGTAYPTVDRHELLEWILYDRRDSMLQHLHAGEVEGLIDYLELTSTQSTTQDVDWKTVINNLKDNRQLFKYPCGFLNLEPCDRLEE